MTSSKPRRAGVPPPPSDGASPGGHGPPHVGAFMVGVDTFSVMSLELLSGIFIWGGGGWLLDRWLGTAHWFFGFGVMLGYAAGLYLVWLRTRETSTSSGQVTDLAPTTRGRARTRGGR